MTTNNANEKLTKKIWLSSFALFAKILCVVIAVFFFIVGAMFFVSPKADAKLFKFFGFKRAEEKCYEQVYKNSGKTSDLYNLIVLTMQHENLNAELDALNKIFEAEDYAEFCNKLDESGVISAGSNKSLYAFVANTNSYLRSELVRCKFNKFENSKDAALLLEIEQDVLNSLKGESLTSLTDTSFSTFLTLVYSSNTLSVSEKKDAITNLINKAREGGSELDELIENRVQNILSNISSTQISEVQRILLKYAEVQLYKGAYYKELSYHDDDTSMTTKASEYKQSYEKAFNEYKNLI